MDYNVDYLFLFIQGDGAEGSVDAALRNTFNVSTAGTVFNATNASGDASGYARPLSVAAPPFLPSGTDPSVPIAVAPAAAHTAIPAVPPTLPSTVAVNTSGEDAGASSSKAETSEAGTSKARKINDPRLIKKHLTVLGTKTLMTQYKLSIPYSFIYGTFPTDDFTVMDVITVQFNVTVPTGQHPPSTTAAPSTAAALNNDTTKISLELRRSEKSSFMVKSAPTTRKILNILQMQIGTTMIIRNLGVNQQNVTEFSAKLATNDEKAGSIFELFPIESINIPAHLSKTAARLAGTKVIVYDFTLTASYLKNARLDFRHWFIDGKVLSKDKQHTSGEVTKLTLRVLDDAVEETTTAAASDDINEQTRSTILLNLTRFKNFTSTSTAEMVRRAFTALQIKQEESVGVEVRFLRTCSGEEGHGEEGHHGEVECIAFLKVQDEQIPSMIELTDAEAEAEELKKVKMSETRLLAEFGLKTAVIGHMQSYLNELVGCSSDALPRTQVTRVNLSRKTGFSVALKRRLFYDDANTLGSAKTPTSVKLVLTNGSVPITAPIVVDPDGKFLLTAFLTVGLVASFKAKNGDIFLINSQSTMTGNQEHRVLAIACVTKTGFVTGVNAAYLMKAIDIEHAYAVNDELGMGVSFIRCLKKWSPWMQQPIDPQTLAGLVTAARSCGIVLDPGKVDWTSGACFINVSSYTVRRSTGAAGLRIARPGMVLLKGADFTKATDLNVIFSGYDKPVCIQTNGWIDKEPSRSFICCQEDTLRLLAAIGAQVGNVVHLKTVGEFTLVWAEQGDGAPIAAPTAQQLKALFTPRSELDEAAVVEAGAVRRCGQKLLIILRGTWPKAFPCIPAREEICWFNLNLMKAILSDQQRTNEFRVEVRDKPGVGRCGAYMLIQDGDGDTLFYFGESVDVYARKMSHERAAVKASDALANGTEFKGPYLYKKMAATGGVGKFRHQVCVLDGCSQSRGKALEAACIALLGAHFVTGLPVGMNTSRGVQVWEHRFIRGDIRTMVNTLGKFGFNIKYAFAALGLPEFPDEDEDDADWEEEEEDESEEEEEEDEAEEAVETAAAGGSEEQA